MKKIFHIIAAEISMIFGKLPTNWETDTAEVIAGIEKAKSLLENPITATVAALFPNGIGTTVLTDLEAIINNILPELEIGQACIEAVKNTTDPTEKANIIIQTILAAIAKLPANWQGKHWEDVAVSILTVLLKVTTTEAKAILHVKLGQIQAG